MLFCGLSREVILKVVDKEVALLQKTLDEKQHHARAQRGGARVARRARLRPEFGARPMARLVETAIKRPLAEALLFGDAATRAARVQVDRRTDGEDGLEPELRLITDASRMPIYMLTDELRFPPPEGASAEGIVAIGGDFRAERLLLGYAQGIFPWPSEGLPLLWFSPDPRFALEPSHAHIPRSLRKRMRKAPLRGPLRHRVRARSSAPAPSNAPARASAAPGSRRS